MLTFRCRPAEIVGMVTISQSGAVSFQRPAKAGRA
jgi:hypothetical protein